ncbi:Baseplate J family protein [Alkaliphilus metalliredigens QYMF]|uniref:Baseplate J family protein n=1 Tax=Alkaliphilus metalliredigens (strain QYMF) TaxID=293826 RepID=A6TQW6_ALKMQ|nr:baseplate J/gp47 family protein [Alkaliphilus metalliredigens]ABR48584.1 Baseplate J family protein [Alkaliphilus metalliredigens QYMF]
MYEGKTKEQIHEEMLDQISKKYDKTPGEFIYDATKPPAIKLEEVYKDLDDVIDKLDIENLKGEELERFVYQRTGIGRKKATYSIGRVLAKGNGSVNAGNLFETEGGIQFEAVQGVIINGEGYVNIKCAVAGGVGNVPANQIKFMPVTISGINEVVNTEATTGGFEAETDQALLQRYYERRQTPATSGNKAHYKNWAKEVPGVGDAKVFSLWNGDNTVKVILIDAEKQPASLELIEMVQEYIDPGMTGLGEGEAPIGAYCTISSAIGKEINISFTAIKDPSVSDLERQQSVEKNINNYLKEIAFVENYVSYGIVGSLILQSEGIEDYSDLVINDGSSNISIGNEEVAILGSVVINE